MQSPSKHEQEFNALSMQWNKFADETLIEVGSSTSSNALNSNTANSSDDEIQFVGVVKDAATTSLISQRKRPLSSLDTSGDITTDSGETSNGVKRHKLAQTVRTKLEEEFKNGTAKSTSSDSDDVQVIYSTRSEQLLSVKTSGGMPKLSENIWTQIKAYRDKFPKKFQHFDNQIMRHYERNIQNDLTYFWKMQIRRKILDIIHGIYSDAELFVVGSTINGCGSKDADMDLCCTVERYDAFMNERTFALKTLRKIRTQLFKNKFLLEMTNCALINAKVPILRLTFNGKYKELEVDLNVNNVAGVYNSYLLHYYSRIDDRFPALCLLIKHWAKANNIGDASAGTLNSYSIILLVIHFMQVAIKPAILPNLQECFPELFHENRPLDQCALFQDLEKRYPDPSKNTCSPGELLIAFFDYYAAFDFDNWAISIANARVFPRHELIANTERFKIFIEEPFDKNNTARCVTTLINFELIQTSIQNARNWFLAKRRPDIKNLGVQDCFNLERQGLV